MPAANASYDWAPPRTAKAFTGYLQDGQPNPAGLVLRLAMHTPIPCTAEDWEESGQKRMSGTILAFPKLGFVSAPYSKKQSKTSKYAPPPPPTKPQPLLEPVETAQGEVTVVRMYNFHKGNSSFDKGDRDESSVSVLAVGQAITYHISKYLYEKGEKNVFPEGSSGFIPAFSVVEVQLNPSHNQSDGFGFKMAKVRRMDHSLYSYMGCAGALERIQKTAEGALEFVREQAKLCAPVANSLEQARYGFYSQVDSTARVVDVRDDLEFVRIECPRGSSATPVPGAQAVDVSHEDLMRFANAPGDLLAARTLVDLAIAAGAVKMFVTYNEYFNKQEPALAQFRGAPLVDCAAFLEPVREGELQESAEEGSVTFPADWRVPHDPQLQSVALRVATTPREQEEGEVAPEDVFGTTKAFVAPPCPDMPLVSPACAFARGYRVLVGNPGSGEEDAEDAYYVLDAYFNTSAPRGAGGAGGGSGGATAYKRVKI
jgi:hypothetical protein